jgi:hypothetical protein
MKFTVPLCTVAVVAMSNLPVGGAQGFTSLIMLSTVKIQGPSAQSPGATTLGTGFLVGRPDSSDPKAGAQVLVTAAHVLDEIGGDAIDVVVRVRKTRRHIRKVCREGSYS